MAAMMTTAPCMKVRSRARDVARVFAAREVARGAESFFFIYRHLAIAGR
jgi:hypothetical protein